jgi:excisionase family DNA binding protein
VFAFVHGMDENPSPKSGCVEPPSAIEAAAPREQILPAAVYLTEEAAELLRCRPSTIRHAVRNGRLRAQGRPFRIIGAELIKFAS